MLNIILRTLERLIPKKVYRMGQPVYHYLLALSGALIYRFPSRRLKVVGITGTKGKSTTAELVNAILEAAGYKTALMGTIRFKVGEASRPNRYKMSMPGRFFVQKFLHEAVAAGCDWIILEMTSEGAKQFRHKFIALDALIFTNLAPEHIESHGSFEKYRQAKLAIARELSRSPKKDAAIIANIGDNEGERFLNCGAPRKFPYVLEDGYPYEVLEHGSVFTFGKKTIHLQLDGDFNIENAVAAATFAESQGISIDAIKKGLESVSLVRGRVEHIHEGPLDDARGRQSFDVVVDYAHTPESLEALYGAFAGSQNICVLGNTGGGRDMWKRPKMAAIAEKHCAEMILTNEDPYDEDPQKIIDEMRAGVSDTKKVTIIMDRQGAIREALRRAQERAQKGTPDEKIAVLITGKGTDPFIMGPRGAKTPWDDATVAREELKKVFAERDIRV